MELSPDVLTLSVPDIHAAQAFYASVFSPTVTDHGEHVELDMYGKGRIALYESDTAPARPRFRGYTLNFTVDQPSEVEAVMAAAASAGAEVLKPAKKSLFAGVAGVFRAPDGSIWKLAAPTRRDTGPAAIPTKPTETVVILGVASPKASRDFYAALGMAVDRDYGNKFIDFQLSPGLCRLGLMTRKSLAKDSVVKDDGGTSQDTIFECRVESRSEVEAIMSAAVTAGGAVDPDAGESGQLRDLDGWGWRIAVA